MVQGRGVSSVQACDGLGQDATGYGLEFGVRI